MNFRKLKFENLRTLQNTKNHQKTLEIFKKFQKVSANCRKLYENLRDFKTLAKLLFVSFQINFSTFIKLSDLSGRYTHS